MATEHMAQRAKENAVLHMTKTGDVAVITLSRPEKLNALNDGLRDAIFDAFAEAKEDDAVRAVVLTGEGRGFCSGADLTAGPGEAPPPTQNDHMDELGWVGRLALAVYGLDKPVIGAVNGIAVGAGMSLALGCDIRVGSERTRFKTVFVERNLSPDTGMSFFLPRIVGYSRAADLIYTSRMVEAEEAHRIGLLDRLVDHDELLDTAVEIGQQTATWPPLAVRMSKHALQHNQECELEEALRYELAAISHAGRAVNDRKESLAAFREKRTPRFTGT